MSHCANIAQVITTKLSFHCLFGSITTYRPTARSFVLESFTGDSAENTPLIYITPSISKLGSILNNQQIPSCRFAKLKKNGTGPDIQLQPHRRGQGSHGDGAFAHHEQDCASHGYGGPVLLLRLLLLLAKPRTNSASATRSQTLDPRGDLIRLVHPSGDRSCRCHAAHAHPSTTQRQ